MIISPYTRGGKVFTERGDHSSILMFLEEYLTAKGYSNVTADQLSDWRREHMSNLVNAFDFDNVCPSAPILITPTNINPSQTTASPTSLHPRAPSPTPAET